MLGRNKDKDGNLELWCSIPGHVLDGLGAIVRVAPRKNSPICDVVIRVPMNRRAAMNLYDDIMAHAEETER